MGAVVWCSAAIVAQLQGAYWWISWGLLALGMLSVVLDDH